MLRVFLGVVVGCALTDYFKKNYTVEKWSKGSEFSLKITKKTAE